jgi:hypothetical protein
VSFEGDLARYHARLESAFHDSQEPCPKCHPDEGGTILCSECAEIERDEAGDRRFHEQRDMEGPP